jgi:hypothetical protein
LIPTVLLLACSRPDDTTTTPPTTPTTPTTSTTPTVSRPGGAPLSLVLAGAPIFGEVANPGYTSAFTTLADAGFDGFFPLYVTSEVDGASTTTDHLLHFLAPSLAGVPAESSCAGPNDPYAAAEGRLQIWFPGFLLMELQDRTQPIDRATFRGHLDEQDAACWRDHPGVLGGFHTYDEALLYHAIDTYLGVDSIDLDNIAVASEVVREELGVPTVWVESFVPYQLELAGLSGSELDTLVAAFDAELQRLAPTVESFDFNIYPVPDYRIDLVHETTALAAEVAPQARTLIVLQAFGYDHITGGVTPGRVPTLEETRYMAFDAVAAGADVVVWYGASALDLSRPDQRGLWEDVLTVAGELDGLSDLSTGDALAFDLPEGVGARLTVHDDGRAWLVVTRRADSEGDVTLTLPVDASRASAVVGPPPSVDGRTLTVTLPARGVGVYTW